MDRDAGDAGHHRKARVQHQDEQCVIERVPAHDVAELVAEDGACLFRVEQLEGARVDDDEGAIDTEDPGVRKRCLGDEELGLFRPVERFEDLPEESIELGELLLPHPNGVRLENESNAALSDEPDQTPSHLVEARNRPQGLKSGAVGGMLPGHRQFVSGGISAR